MSVETEVVAKDEHAAETTSVETEVVVKDEDAAVTSSVETKVVALDEDAAVPYSACLGKRSGNKVRLCFSEYKKTKTSDMHTHSMSVETEIVVKREDAAVTSSVEIVVKPEDAAVTTSVETEVVVRPEDAAVTTSVETEVVVQAKDAAVPYTACPGKRCGDKVRLCFSDYTKAKTPGLDYTALEAGPSSVLSVVDTDPSHSIRYLVLVKAPFAGKNYAYINVPDKFVFYDVLAEGDEVMFASAEKSMCKVNERNCGAVKNITQDSVAVVQECLQEDANNEGDSIYTLRLSVRGTLEGECFWVLRCEIHYIKRCVEMTTKPAQL